MLIACRVCLLNLLSDISSIAPMELDFALAARRAVAFVFVAMEWLTLKAATSIMARTARVSWLNPTEWLTLKPATFMITM